MRPSVGRGCGGFPASTPSQQAGGRPRQIEAGHEGSPFRAQSEQGSGGPRRTDGSVGRPSFPPQSQEGHRRQRQIEGGNGGSPFPRRSQQGHVGQRQIEGGNASSTFPPQSQQGQRRQLQIEGDGGPAFSPRTRMEAQQEEAFGFGDRGHQRLNHINPPQTSFMRWTQSFQVTQTRSILSHSRDGPRQPGDPFSQQSQQRQQSSNVRVALRDIRLTTSSHHHEPRPESWMREKDFALAIATDYVAAWSKFTQAGITRYFQAIENNMRDAAVVVSKTIPEKRKYLKQMLPRQFEEMKRQIRGGDELQVRQLVDWIRKEKIWEKEHGWDPGLWSVPALGDYRHLLPWMQGAKVNPDLAHGSGNQGGGAGHDNRGEYGSWAWGDLL